MLDVTIAMTRLPIQLKMYSVLGMVLGTLHSRWSLVLSTTLIFSYYLYPFYKQGNGSSKRLGTMSNIM